MSPIFVQIILGLSLATFLILGMTILKKIRQMNPLLQALLDFSNKIQTDLTSIATSLQTIEGGIPADGSLGSSDVQILKQSLQTVSAAADTLAASAVAAAQAFVAGTGSVPDTGSAGTGE